MDADLVAALSEEQYLPREALRRAVQHPQAVAGPVLDVLARAAADPDGPSDAEANLLFWGLHALAAARDVRVFPDLLRLLRYDDETLQGLLGDAVTETLPRVLAGTFDGDTEAFGRFLLDSTLDPFVHGSAFAALAFLTRDGRIDRAVAGSLLVRFDDARVAVDENAWAAWEETIAYLGFSDLAPRAQAARRDGRLTQEVSDAGWFRRALRQVTAEPPSYDAFHEDRYGYLDDPVTALAWTAEEAGQPVVNPFKAVGRNDPCPCGSGRKFKKCCLDAKLPPPPLPGLH